MYCVGDLILYGRTGVCRVEEINGDAGSGEQQYYSLRPLYQNCCIRTPVAGRKVFSRPIISGAEAEKLIRRIPQLEAQPYYNQNLNQLREHYRACLESFTCESLVCLMKSLWMKKREVEAKKRKFGAVDERFLREAEDLLYGELAAALEIERSAVENYIANTLEKE